MVSKSHVPTKHPMGQVWPSSPLSAHLAYEEGRLSPQTPAHPWDLSILLQKQAETAAASKEVMVKHGRAPGMGADGPLGAAGTGRGSLRGAPGSGHYRARRLHSWTQLACDLGAWQGGQPSKLARRAPGHWRTRGRAEPGVAREWQWPLAESRVCLGELWGLEVLPTRGPAAPSDIPTGKGAVQAAGGPEGDTAKALRAKSWGIPGGPGLPSECRSRGDAQGAGPQGRRAWSERGEQLARAGILAVVGAGTSFLHACGDHPDLLLGQAAAARATGTAATSLSQPLPAQHLSSKKLAFQGKETTSAW